MVARTFDHWPELLGLEDVHLRHPNAEIGFLTNQGISIFKTIAEAWDERVLR